MHYRGSTTKLNQFTTYDVFWDLVSLEVFDVLVLTVYDFCQLPSFDQLLIHVHLHLLMKRLRMLFNIGTDNTSNNRAPGKNTKQRLLPASRPSCFKPRLGHSYPSINSWFSCNFNYSLITVQKRYSQKIFALTFLPELNYIVNINIVVNQHPQREPFG